MINSDTFSLNKNLESNVSLVKMMVALPRKKGNVLLLVFRVPGFTFRI